MRKRRSLGERHRDAAIDPEDREALFVNNNAESFQRFVSIIEGIRLFVWLVGIGTLMLSATGLAGFPTRVAHVAGLPLSAPIAIALMGAGGLLVRQVGGVITLPRCFASYSGNSRLP